MCLPSHLGQLGIRHSVYEIKLQTLTPYELQTLALAQIKQQLDKKLVANSDGGDDGNGGSSEAGIRQLTAWFQNLSPETVSWLSLGLALQAIILERGYFQSWINCIITSYKSLHLLQMLN